jgi:hypothetical protein
MTHTQGAILMERRAFAVTAVAAGLVLGILGTVFFYNKLLGISVVLYTALGAGVIIEMARRRGLHLLRRNLWPLLPILFFALMIAVRDDPMIVALNVATILALGGLMLYYLPLTRPLDTDSLQDYTLHTIESGVAILPSALGEAGDAWRWLRDNRRRKTGAATAVVRGLLFAAPVLLVFVYLLGSADAVFARMVGDVLNGLLSIFGIQYLEDTVSQGIFTLVLAVAITGAISFGVARRPARSVTVPVPAAPAADADDNDDDAAYEEVDDLPEKGKPAFKLGMIESTIVLGSVVALFAVFVVIQFAYFFGGQAHMDAVGLTYAQYARRGFFELVIVAALTLGLALGLDRFTVRQERHEAKLFHGLALALVALTTVMLVSAAQRMWLYEQAFGFTQLRVYTHMFILWLGVLFGVFVTGLFRLRPNIFSFGTLLVIIGYLLSLNLMNVDAYIADRNIARYVDQSSTELDVAFLRTLSVDAAPAIMQLYQQTPDENVKTWAGQWLVQMLYRLDGERQGVGQTVFSWNASRATAYAQLNAIRDGLPEYDGSFFYSNAPFVLQSELNADRSSGWDTVGTPSSGE